MDYTRLKEFLDLGQIAYLENEPMSAHTTFNIGGSADIFITPKTEDELFELISALKGLEIPFFILGRGSNLLVSDLGIEGAVIYLSELKGIELLEDNVIECSAGAKLSMLCSFALENELSGLEFAWGIPGTVGGALYMNAGAYDSDISAVVLSARVITEDGIIKEFRREEMELGYRTSVFSKNGGVILSAKFILKFGDKNEIRAGMDSLMERRRSKQPLEFPSAGSTFKRPQGNFAGTLIEKSGLKGVSVGGAQVSEKHAGFIINTGGATASDVKQLIEKVKNEVFLQSSIMLEEEVKIIGRT